jgi:hypothetical protein
MSEPQVQEQLTPEAIPASQEPVSTEQQESKSVFEGVENQDDALARVDEIMLNGTDEERALLEKEIFSKMEEHEQPPAQAPTPPPQGETIVATPPDGNAGTAATDTSSPDSQAPKLFEVSYHGINHQRPDDNGLLGYPTTGHLKRAKIHADLRISELENETLEARRYAEQKDREAKELQKRFQELEAKTKQQPPVAPSQAQQPNLVQAQQQGQPSDPPTPPDYPELSTDDPLDYTHDDREKLKSYNRDRARYDRDVTDYIRSLSQRQPVVKTEIPEEIKSEIEQLRSYREQVERERVEKEQKEKQKSFWGAFDNFSSQDTYKSDYGIPDSFENLHQKVESWEDRLAMAYGYQKPFAAYDASNPDWQKFNDAKRQIAGAYLSGNQEVVGKTQGIDPPAGYENYFKLVELHNTHKSLVDKGLLGPGSKLADAHFYNLRESGQLDRDVNDLRAQATIQAQRDVSNAIKEHQQYVSAIPGNMSGQSGSIAGGYTMSDMNWFLDVSPQQYVRLSPQDRAKYDAIAKAHGGMSGI